jgi:predicted 2-oxoglutarate/Fe(II)-dependent dioxygenase YbiX
MLDDILFDLVRLLPDDERSAVLEGAAMRRRALAVATRLGVRPSAERVRAAAATFRRARDITKADDLSAWCADRGMTTTEFARLVTEEATLDTLGGSEGSITAQDIADFLRVVEGSERLFNLSRELRSQGNFDTPAHSDEEALRTWYEAELGVSVPGDVDRDARRRGFERSADLAQALRRTARWSAPSDLLSMGEGDPAPKENFAHSTLGPVNADLLSGRWWMLAWGTTEEALLTLWEGATHHESVVCVVAPESTRTRYGVTADEALVWLVSPQGHIAAMVSPTATHAQLRIAESVKQWGKRAETNGATAPVLVVSGAFENDFCIQLMEAWHHGEHMEGAVTAQAYDGSETFADKTIKRRTDWVIRERALESAVKARLARRVFPEIKKVFQFEVMRCEGFRVGCYRTEDGGVFLPHRDDANATTATRRFALSVNLNQGSYQGGTLKLPEYGAVFDAPTGAALVYSATVLHEITPMIQGNRFALVGFFSGTTR